MSRKDPVEIWQISDKDECYDVNTGEAVPIYKYVSPDGDGYRPETVLRKNANEASLEDLVSLCDQDAESVNAHDYCGAHRLLGAMLYRWLGRKVATGVMRDIAVRRGLHGMGGICGLRDCYAELGVGKAGHDWDGSYGQ